LRSLVLLLFSLGLIGESAVTWVSLKKAPDIIRNSLRDTPYDLTVGRISGTPWSGVTLHDVRLRFREPSEEWAQIRQVQIRLRWRALLKKKIRVTRFVLVDPVIRVVRRADGSLWTSRSFPQKESNTPWVVVAQDVEIRNGRLEWLDQRQSPSRALALTDWTVRAQYAENGLTIDQWDMRLGSGTVTGHGFATLQQDPSAEMVFTARQLPFEKVLAAFQPPSPGLRLPHSGQWVLRYSSDTWHVSHTGRIAQAALNMKVSGSPDDPLRVTAEGWVIVPEGAVDFNVKQGRGPVQVRYSSGPLKALAYAQVDLPRGVVNSTYSVQQSSVQVIGHAVWNKGKGVKLDGDVTGLFTNRAVAHVSGTVPPSRDGITRFVWDDLRLTATSGDVWSARQGGFIEKRGDRLVVSRLEVDSEAVGVSSAPWLSAEGSFPLKKDDSLSVHLQTRQMDPASLNALFPEMQITSGGRLQIRAHVQGALRQPQIEGSVRGQIPKIKMKNPDLELKDIQLHVQADGKEVFISSFVAKTKKGFVRLSGRSTLPALDYHLQAERLVFALASGTRIDGGLDVRVTGTLTYPKLNGDIRLEEATIRPPEDKSDKQTEPVPASEDAPPSLWVRTAMDVTAEWSQDVWYRDGLSGIETSGDLRIQKASGSPKPTVVGDIALIRGGYNYYGKDFAIESGQIRFTGSRDINPLLNIESTYHREPTTIYLTITGTAETPALKLRSSPPLSQQDIISVLVFGVPIRSFDNTEGGTNRQEEAMRAAGSLLGGYITRGLRQTGIEHLNLDVVDIQPRSDGSELTLGRYVTRNLFISYGQTFNASGSRALGAEYYLNRIFTLKGEAGSLERNYLDLLLRIPLNRGEESRGRSRRNTPFKNTFDDPGVSPTPK